MSVTRNRVAAGLAIVAAGSLAVFGIATPAQAASKKLTIAFVMGAEADPFFKAMKVGATAEAAAKGVNLVWQGNPSVYSPATQIPVAIKFLQQSLQALF